MVLRRIQERALRKVTHRARLLAACCGLILLCGCANDAIFPTTSLPPAPEGPAPDFPSFTAKDIGSDEERQILTPLERQEMEARMAKLAKDREAGVTRRIQQTK